MTEKLENQSELIEIFNLLIKGVSSLGATNFKSAINSVILSKELSFQNYNTVIEYILDSIIYEWREHKVTRDQLFLMNQRGEVVIARKIAILLIKYHIDIHDKTIAGFFGFKETKKHGLKIIGKMVTWYNSLDKNNKIDIVYIEKHDKLKMQVMKFIDTLKVKEEIKK
ncbi:MAG: hypothetical protein AABY22_31340 [Nanoarchaeota archaeon]